MSSGINGVVVRCGTTSCHLDQDNNMAAEDIINQHVLNHFTIDTTDLVKNHPPRFQNGHKKLVYGLACPDGWRSHHGSITCTRWKQLELPKSITFTVPEPTIVDGFFAYQPPSKGEELWFMNFADSHVFGYYSGSLFAQDESQCLEHPALCALREYLLTLPNANNNTLRDPTRTSVTTTTKGTSTKTTTATPILVSGVERRVHFHTDPNPAEGRPHGLYGNQFRTANTDTIRRAAEIFDARVDGDGKAYYSNILAMVAPRGHWADEYDKETVRTVLETAYTGFVAARMESQVNAGLFVRRDNGTVEASVDDGEVAKEKVKVKIHTGNWGCGAFGGNPVLMALLQMAAAQLASVELVYHVLGEKNREDVGEALVVLREILGGEGELELGVFVDKVCRKGYKWGTSNGT